ncbi:hypothetical protein V1477_003693 [Vespula maculifrons]|uniref:Uncharacterized protein n=1 Tax=Vespula maculifrons TaxID=7453 RepID=A0ABD2CUE4_VESMC
MRRPGFAMFLGYEVDAAEKARGNPEGCVDREGRVESLSKGPVQKKNVIFRYVRFNKDEKTKGEKHALSPVMLMSNLTENIL